MEYGLALLHAKSNSEITKVLESAEYEAMTALVGGCHKANRLIVRNLIGTDSPYKRSLILRAKWYLEKEQLGAQFIVYYAL